jgi:predicted PolB exonuclease-like 3'-5' exonuclease
MINIPLQKILFIDIETVGIESDWSSFTEKHKELSEKFEDYQDWFVKRFPECSGLSVPEMFLSKSALIPEFAKIVCISASFVTPSGEIKTQSFYGDDEKQLLTDVRELLNKVHKMDFYLCGHNLKNFDIPMMSKRMVINGILPPKIFPSYDTKPWEIKAIDTKEVWQFGSFAAISSLELACVSLGIDSSKNTGVSGNQVHDTYWNKNGIDDIVIYCEEDVKVLVKLIEKLKNLS